MRRFLCLALLTGFALANVGCLVVSSHKGTYTHGHDRKQAVALNGEIYVVDVSSYDVRKIDPVTVVEAETVTYTEIVTTETQEEGD